MKIKIIGNFIFLSKEIKNELEKIGEVEFREVDPSEENFIKYCKDAEVIISWGKPTSKVIKACNNLKYFGYLLTGYDSVILDKDLVNAAKERKIIFGYTPKFAREAVAEYTLASLLVLCKKIIPSYENLKKNHNESFVPYRQETFLGGSLGIIGLGNIGTALARKAYHLGANILCFTPFPNEKIPDFPLRFVSLKEIFQKSDFIAITCELNRETMGMIDKKLLEGSKKDVVLVNTARAKIFNLNDLLDFARKNGDARLLIDVIDQKSDIFKKLIELPNVIITPHIAGNTLECMYKCTDLAVANLRNYLQKKDFWEIPIYE